MIRGISTFPSSDNPVSNFKCIITFLTIWCDGISWTFWEISTRWRQSCWFWICALSFRVIRGKIPHIGSCSPWNSAWRTMDSSRIAPHTHPPLSITNIFKRWGELGSWFLWICTGLIIGLPMTGIFVWSEFEIRWLILCTVTWRGIAGFGCLGSLEWLSLEFR